MTSTMAGTMLIKTGDTTLTELPRHRLIVWGSRSHYFYLPLPYVHYRFHLYPNHVLWSLRSVSMGTSEDPVQSSWACLPNISGQSYGPPCTPLNSSGSQLELINRFWAARFNGEINSFLQHPVWLELRNRCGVTRNNYITPVFRYWETLSIEEALELPWPKKPYRL
jgi:hypothetical protein